MSRKTGQAGEMLLALAGVPGPRAADLIAASLATRLCIFPEPTPLRGSAQLRIFPEGDNRHRLVS